MAPLPAVGPGAAEWAPAFNATADVLPPQWHAEQARSNDWITGAAINIAGSVFISLGTNVVKLGHMQQAKQHDHSPRAHGLSTRSLLWYCGWALFVFGSSLNFVSFSFCAQSLLAALGAVQFISNGCFARYVLGEVVTRQQVKGTALIIVGIMIVISVGNHKTRVYSVDELLHLYMSAPYLIYLTLSLSSGGAAHILFERASAAPPAKSFASNEGCLAPGLPTSPSTPSKTRPVSLLTPTSREERGERREEAPRPSPPQEGRASMTFLYALASASVGTQSIIMAKSISQLIRLTFEGTSQLNSPFAYCVVTMFAFSASFWMVRLNKGLRLFPSMYIVPMMQALWTILSVCGGGLYFQEFDDFSAWRAVEFGGGIFIVLFGIFHLAPAGTPPGKPEHELLSPRDDVPLLARPFSEPDRPRTPGSAPGASSGCEADGPAPAPGPGPGADPDNTHGRCATPQSGGKGGAHPPASGHGGTAAAAAAAAYWHTVEAAEQTMEAAAATMSMPGNLSEWEWNASQRERRRAPPRPEPARAVEEGVSTTDAIVKIIRDIPKYAKHWDVSDAASGPVTIV